jgi:CRP-like cAMP-binding protein
MTSDTTPASRTIQKFSKGDYLFKQNDVSQDLYIIKKGNVRIFKIEGNLEIELDSAGSGSVIGEIASIDGGTRSASGVAVEETDALVISSTEFSAILSKIPEWFKKISLILVQRLREVDNKISCSIEGDRTNQVAAMIHLLSKSSYATPTEKAYEISMKFLEDELVDVLCIQPAEVVEILRKLEKRGIIKISHSKVSILSLESIDKLAESVFHTENELPST